MRVSTGTFLMDVYLKDNLENDAKKHFTKFIFGDYSSVYFFQGQVWKSRENKILMRNMLTVKIDGYKMQKLTCILTNYKDGEQVGLITMQNWFGGNTISQQSFGPITLVTQTMLDVNGDTFSHKDYLHESVTDPKFAIERYPRSFKSRPFLLHCKKCREKTSALLNLIRVDTCECIENYKQFCFYDEN